MLTVIDIRPAAVANGTILCDAEPSLETFDHKDTWSCWFEIYPAVRCGRYPEIPNVECQVRKTLLRAVCRSPAREFPRNSGGPACEMAVNNNRVRASLTRRLRAGMTNDAGPSRSDIPPLGTQNRYIPQRQGRNAELSPHLSLSPSLRASRS